MAVIENYLFTGRKPLRDSIVGSLKTKPKILERKTIVEHITERVWGLWRPLMRGWGDDDFSIC
jgi:type I restriction enzyme R subunit